MMNAPEDALEAICARARSRARACCHSPSRHGRRAQRDPRHRRVAPAAAPRSGRRVVDPARPGRTDARMTARSPRSSRTFAPRRCCADAVGARARRHRSRAQSRRQDCRTTRARRFRRARRWHGGAAPLRTCGWRSRRLSKLERRWSRLGRRHLRAARASGRRSSCARCPARGARRADRRRRRRRECARAAGRRLIGVDEAWAVRRPHAIAARSRLRHQDDPPGRCGQVPGRATRS